MPWSDAIIDVRVSSSTLQFTPFNRVVSYPHPHTTRPFTNSLGMKSQGTDFIIWSALRVFEQLVDGLTSVQPLYCKLFSLRTKCYWIHVTFSAATEVITTECWKCLETNMEAAYNLYSISTVERWWRYEAALSEIITSPNEPSRLRNNHFHL